MDTEFVILWCLIKGLRRDIFSHFPDRICVRPPSGTYSGYLSTHLECLAYGNSFANGIGLSISPADWKGPSFFILLLLLQPPLSMDRVHVSLAPFKGFFSPPRYMAMPPDPITLWPWPAYIYPSSLPPFRYD